MACERLVEGRDGMSGMGVRAKGKEVPDGGNELVWERRENSTQ